MIDSSESSNEEDDHEAMHDHDASEENNEQSTLYYGVHTVDTNNISSLDYDYGDLDVSLSDFDSIHNLDTVYNEEMDHFEDRTFLSDKESITDDEDILTENRQTVQFTDYRRNSENRHSSFHKVVHDHCITSCADSTCQHELPIDSEQACSDTLGAIVDTPTSPLGNSTLMSENTASFKTIPWQHLQDIETNQLESIGCDLQSNLHGM